MCRFVWAYIPLAFINVIIYTLTSYVNVNLFVLSNNKYQWWFVNKVWIFETVVHTTINVYKGVYTLRTVACMVLPVLA